MRRKWKRLDLLRYERYIYIYISVGSELISNLGTSILLTYASITMFSMMYLIRFKKKQCFFSGCRIKIRLADPSD